MRSQIALLLFAVAAAAMVASTSSAADPKQKLQIGVKKRVENCQMKSRKGDRLKMHYTVGIQCHSRSRVLYKFLLRA